MDNNNIVFHSHSTYSAAAGNCEMLRIAPDGFYVRGVKVPVDDKEALTVYNSFHQWLAWAQLQDTK